MKNMKTFFMILVALSLLTSNQTARSQSHSIDLSNIGHISSKGRIQDSEYNHLQVVNQLIEKESQAIPLLIAKIEDETPIKSNVIDYWSKVTIGDVALIILTDFFTDSSWKKTTIAGVKWDEMLERRSSNMTGEEVLRKFIAKHGRKTLKAKWQKIWRENKNRIYWDSQERCFKLSSSQ